MTAVRAASFLAALALAGCGGDNDEATTSSALAQGGVGPGLSIAQAARYEGTEPVLVNGYIVQAPNDQPKVCDSLAESDPPQCGGPFLILDGPDPATLGYDLESKDGTQWTQQRVQVIGVVRGGGVLFIEEVER